MAQGLLIDMDGVVYGGEIMIPGADKFIAQLLKENATKEACRALYMSCLHLLDEDEIAVFAPTKTNYEYF